MASNDTSFTAQVTRIVAAWLQPINDFVFKGRNPNFATSTGAANVYTITLPTGSLYSAASDGDTFTFKAHQTNTTAATYNIVVGSTTIATGAIQVNGAALTGNEIQSGGVYVLRMVGTTAQLAGQTPTNSEWVTGPAPTYISATQFSVVGDQRSILQVGRRLKTVNTGGTIYSRITVSAFTALTTVTVINDSGVLDSGLSSVSYGLLAATNVSVPWTSLGTLATTITGGGTSFSIRNNADNADNFIVTDAGNATVRGKLTGASSAMLSPITNSLSGDVALNNTSNYFDGPSISQGTNGTWNAFGQVVVEDTSGIITTARISAKLWDGTTVIASTFVLINVNSHTPISLSGFITSPAGNLRISVKDADSTSGKIVFNGSGNSKDSTITAIRIA